MKIKQYYEELHKCCEIGLQTINTQKYLKKVLANYNCKISNVLDYGLIAFFDFKQAKTIAFRADMDGLPIHEVNDLSYLSNDEKCMHACGHDAHMAMLLDFASYINQQKHLLNNIILIFQPGEEHPGGARLICESQVFKQYEIAYIFALHLYPQGERNCIYTRANHFMAQSNEIDISFKGKNEHVAQSKIKCDPILAAATFIQRSHLINKEINNIIFHTGKISGGTIHNIVADTCTVAATLRTFDQLSYEKATTKILDICESIKVEFNVEYTLKISNGYPPVINNSKVIKRLSNTFPLKILKAPLYLSDDFSYYLNQCQGVYLFLGIYSNTALHTNNFKVDWADLNYGVKFYQSIIKLAW